MFDGLTAAEHHRRVTETARLHDVQAREEAACAVIEETRNALEASAHDADAFFASHPLLKEPDGSAHH